MNPTILMTLAAVGAGFYLYSRKEEEPAAVADARDLTPAEIQSSTPLQEKIEELQASGQLVTNVQEVTTPAGQTVQVITAPTPEVPNRGVLLSTDDEARIQGVWIPQRTMTPAITAEMSYWGYPNLDAWMNQVVKQRIWIRDTNVKFLLGDWEYWRRMAGFGQPALLTQAVVGPNVWNTPLNQEEYYAVLEANGIKFGELLYNAGFRGLGRSRRQNWWFV